MAAVSSIVSGTKLDDPEGGVANAGSRTEFGLNGREVNRSRGSVIAGVKDE
jgi:hypothetical protein